MNKNNKITVHKVGPPFTETDWKVSSIGVFGQIQTEQGFALIGLKVTDTKKDVQSKTIKGKVLLESHLSPTFDPQRYVSNIISFLEVNLGLSQVDIFKHNDMNKTRANPSQGVQEKAEKLVKTLQNEELRSICDKIHTNYNSLNQRGLNPGKIVNQCLTKEESRQVKYANGYSLTIELNQEMQVWQLTQFL